MRKSFTAAFSFAMTLTGQGAPEKAEADEYELERDALATGDATLAEIVRKRRERDAAAIAA